MFKIVRRLLYNSFMKTLLNIRLVLSIKNSRKGKAFIVVGAEGSGNRMMQRFFIGCGCFGDKSHKQLFDYTNPEPPMDKVVWRTSIPQSTIKKPNIEKMYLLMKKLGYDTKIIEVRRNIEDAVLSHVRREISENKIIARKKIIWAWGYIDKIRKKYPNKFLRVSYDEFINNKGYRKDLARNLGLEYKEVEVYEKKIRGLFEMGEIKRTI